MSRADSSIHPRHHPLVSHNAQPCAVCGRRLSVHEQSVGKTCSRQACKNRYVSQQAQAELGRKEALRDRADALQESLVCGGSMQPDPERAVGVLPSNDRRLVGLSKRRKQVFIDRLMGIISQAAAIRFGNAQWQDDGTGYDQPAELSETNLAVLGNGCAVCRGHCCPQGDGHAFLHVDTILGFMEQNPEMRPIDVLEAYVSRIGRRTYENSCVYHGERGCTLARQMRSKVCNGYLCQGITEVLYQLEACSTSNAFVISVSDYHPHDASHPGPASTRAATIDPQGFTQHDIDGSTNVDHECDA